MNTAFTKKAAGTRRVLYVVHADYPPNERGLPGGTQRHLQDLAGNLPPELEPVVACRAGDQLDVILHERRGDAWRPGQTLRFSIGPEPAMNQLQAEIPSVDDALACVLDALEIDIVHVQHLKGLSLGIYHQAAERHIACLTTLHDFSFICPDWNMRQAGLGFCNGSPDSGTCDGCLSRLLGMPVAEGTERHWRTQHEEALRLNSHIIAPSEATARVYRNLMPSIASRVSVIEHGIDPSLFAAPDGAPAESSQPKDRFSIAVLGVFALIKGSRLIGDATKLSPEGLRWCIIGQSLNPQQDAYLASGADIVRIEHYRPADLAGLMRELDVDVICLPSQVFESFSYTLSEAMALGLPVVVSDLGALATRVEASGGGWIIPYDIEPQKLVDFFGELARGEHDFAQVAERARTLPQRTVEQMVADYVRLYEEESARASAPARRPYSSALLRQAAGLPPTFLDRVKGKAARMLRHS